MKWQLARVNAITKRPLVYIKLCKICIWREEIATLHTSLTQWLFLSSFLRALAAERRCITGTVQSSRQGGRSGQVGLEQRPPHLLLTSHPAQLTCWKLRCKWNWVFTVRTHAVANSFLIKHFFGLFQSCLLLQGLFPLVCTLCEQRMGCNYFAFEGTSLACLFILFY